MKNSNQPIKVTDIITPEDINSWTADNIILINAPSGSGKSYFIKNVLYEKTRTLDGKILYLLHRKRCIDQFQGEIEADDKTNGIELKSYQSLESSGVNHGTTLNLNRYSYIVCDEFHYFLNDSEFNNKTDISLKMILEAEKVYKIFLSATADDMEDYIREMLPPYKQDLILKYSIPSNYNYIRNLTFFYRDEDIEDIIRKTIEDNEKAIVFLNSAEKAYKLYNKFRDNSMFICSQYNKTYGKHMNKTEVDNMLKNEKFECNILFATRTLDAGANLIDRSIRTIVCDIVDISTLIQSVGRKRIIDTEDTVNVYIKAVTNQQLAGFVRSMQRQTGMADFLIKYGEERLLAEYSRQYDKSGIIYQEYEKNDGKGHSVAKVNMLRYTQKKNMITLFNKLMKQKYGYCKHIAKIFGFKDSDGNYTYDVYGKDHSLEAFLQEYVDTGKVLLRQKDRKPLIEKLNIRKNGKLIKGLTPLNAVLEESKLPYRIEEFRTTETVDGKRKDYQRAWRIIIV